MTSTGAILAGLIAPTHADCGTRKISTKLKPDADAASQPVLGTRSHRSWR